MSNITQAIIRKSYTEALTFTGVPSEALRKEMTAKGFKYKNGQWVRHESQSEVVAEEQVAGKLAA